MKISTFWICFWLAILCVGINSLSEEIQKVGEILLDLDKLAQESAK